jgi:hypothetical protein
MWRRYLVLKVEIRGLRVSHAREPFIQFSADGAHYYFVFIRGHYVVGRQSLFCALEVHVANTTFGVR